MKPEYIDLSEAAKRTPGHPHMASVWRWCRKGVKSRSGDRIYLSHVRAGGRIFTTAEDLERFFAMVAAADTLHFQRDAESPTSKPTSSQRARSIDRANKVLTNAGII